MLRKPFTADNSPTAIYVAVPLTGFIRLNVEKRINDPRGRERVRKVEQGKCDDYQTCGLEEYSLPRFVRDIERPKREERKYRKGAERKDEHRECAVHETPCGECIELHGLGKSARQDEGADAYEKRSEIEIVPAPAHHMAGKPRRHRYLQSLREVEHIKQVHSKNKHDEGDHDPENDIHGVFKMERAADESDDTSENEEPSEPAHVK